MATPAKKGAQLRPTTPSEARAPLLAQFLRKQILLRDAADGGGEVGAELPELGVTRRRPLAVAAEIDPFGLAGEGALEYRRQRRRGRPFEIARRIVPGELAVGARDQERVGALVREPIGVSFPAGRRRRRGSEQNREAGLVERLFDRRPQMGGRGGCRRRPATPGAGRACRGAAPPIAAPPRSVCLAVLYEMKAS